MARADLLNAAALSAAELARNVGRRGRGSAGWRKNAGLLYCFTLLGAALAMGVLHNYRGWSLLALLALPLAFYPVRLALSDRSGRALLPMLGATARLQAAVGVLLTIGLLL